MELVAPRTSRTSNVTAAGPATWNTCEAVGRLVSIVSKVPSPSQSHRTDSGTPGNWSSVEADASNVTGTPVSINPGVHAKAATGGVLVSATAGWFASSDNNNAVTSKGSVAA